MIIEKNVVESCALPPPPPPPPPLPADFLTKKDDSAEKKGEHSIIKVVDPNAEKMDELKSLKRSQTKLKQVHWDRIDNISNTLWRYSDDQNINKLLDERGILSDLEQFFQVKEATFRKKPVVVAKKKNSHRVSFLPRDLKQTFAINLHQFNALSDVEFVQKVLACDDEINKATNIIEFFNNDAAMEVTSNLLKDLDPYSTNLKHGSTIPRKDPNELERYDRIYLELCFNLSGYWKARSRALFVAITYESDYNDINYQLNQLDTGLKEIKSSTSLVGVLTLIKNIGNFMNDDSKLALGFKLSTLQRLRFLKDSSNKYSLLHYIEKTVRRHFPEYKDFADELSNIKKISTLSVDELEKSVEDFISLVSNCARQIENGALSDRSKLHPDDKIIEYVSKVISKAEKRAAALKLHLSAALRTMNDTMEYYAESFSETNSRNSFFMKFLVFINEYKKAYQENIRNEEEEKNQERRKKALHNMTVKSEAGNTVDNDIMEHLLGRLREKKLLDSRRLAKSIIDKNEDDFIVNESVDLTDSTGSDFTLAEDRQQDELESSTIPNIENDLVQPSAIDTPRQDQNVCDPYDNTWEDPVGKNGKAERQKTIKNDDKSCDESQTSKAEKESD
ncbi:hypothetical protein PMKS-000212 [Pichia membranifaciens]|uniref:FH2 domain-containing protein n=1 Tax=Pichia membranifaciens TaxID=4926 RepID=A0A1Q2YB25_9ASCO|nr:hypothetical protein PMKS-000212 [Pichia membranifaciens]